jgi:hypothetical protein
MPHDDSVQLLTLEIKMRCLRNIWRNLRRTSLFHYACVDQAATVHSLSLAFHLSFPAELLCGTYYVFLLCYRYRLHYSTVPRRWIKRYIAEPVRVFNQSVHTSRNGVHDFSQWHLAIALNAIIRWKATLLYSGTSIPSLNRRWGSAAVAHMKTLVSKFGLFPLMTASLSCCVTGTK